MRIAAHATILSLGGAALLAGAPSLHAQQPITEATRTLEKRDGYFPLYWDTSKGRLPLEIPAGRLDQDFLYLPSRATGIGTPVPGSDSIGEPLGRNRSPGSNGSVPGSCWCCRTPSSGR
jgi:hypothetical protein